MNWCRETLGSMDRGQIQARSREAKVVLSRRVRGLWLYAIICSLWGARGDIRTCCLRDARTKKRKTRVRTNKRKQESRRAVIGEDWSMFTQILDPAGNPFLTWLIA